MCKLAKATECGSDGTSLIRVHSAKFDITMISFQILLFFVFIDIIVSSEYGAKAIFVMET